MKADKTNKTELELVRRMADARCALSEVAKELLTLHETKEYKMEVQGAFHFEVTIRVI